MGRLKKLKKIRIHREGTHILWASFLLLLLINAALYWGIELQNTFLCGSSSEYSSLSADGEFLSMSDPSLRAGH